MIWKQGFLPIQKLNKSTQCYTICVTWVWQWRTKSYVSATTTFLTFYSHECQNEISLPLKFNLNLLLKNKYTYRQIFRYHLWVSSTSGCRNALQNCSVTAIDSWKTTYTRWDHTYWDTTKYVFEFDTLCEGRQRVGESCICPCCHNAMVDFNVFDVYSYNFSLVAQFKLSQKTSKTFHAFVS